MTTKFKEKFRLDSTRLSGYDYTQSAMYHVTICTKKKKSFLGDLVRYDNTSRNDSKVILNQIGMIADGCWNDLPDHFSNIELDEFVVMPDHLHGIIIIHKKTIGDENKETLHATSLQADPSELSSNMSVISPKTGSLSVIIRSFKSAVTYHARKIHPGFGWQPRFHDHIIRNMDELERIRKYIRSNPDNH